MLNFPVGNVNVGIFGSKRMYQFHLLFTWMYKHFHCFSVPVEVKSLSPANHKQSLGIKVCVHVKTVCCADLIWTSLLDNKLDEGIWQN